MAQGLKQIHQPLAVDVPVTVLVNPDHTSVTKCDTELQGQGCANNDPSY
jgi:hypothetical protein